MAQQKTMATCPECGAKVAKDRLKTHVERVHRKVKSEQEATAREKSKALRSSKKSKSKVSPWPAVIIAAIMASSSLGVLWYLSKPSENPNPPVTNRRAIINTNYGSFTIELREDRAPVATANFIKLANQGFFNGLTFHRIVADFVIQGGDGGSTQKISWENTGLKNKKYTVAMARSADSKGNYDTLESANTATSQFFVNLKDNPNLDSYAYPFVVFGAVIQGQSVVDTIAQVPVNGETPVSPVTMYSVTIVT